MVAQMKEEYLAAGLRKQIESLGLVLLEMEKEKLGEAAIAWRIKAVELDLRRLRTVSFEDVLGRYVPTMPGNREAGREAA